MENAVFGVCQLRDPSTDFQKNWHSWLCRGPHPTCKFWGHSVQRGRVCACVKLSPSGVYFFSIFNGPCTSLQVGLLDRSSPLTAQMMCPRGVHVLFMVSLIKKYFSLFLTQKCEKLHYTLWELWTAITGIVEDTYKLFAPNGGFSGSRNRMVSFKFTPDWPLLPWQPIVVISTQSWP